MILPTLFVAGVVLGVGFFIYLMVKLGKEEDVYDPSASEETTEEAPPMQQEYRRYTPRYERDDLRYPLFDAPGIPSISPDFQKVEAMEEPSSVSERPTPSSAVCDPFSNGVNH